MIGSAAEGCPGHGPAHLLVERAAEVGFQWDPDLLGWSGLVCLLSATLLALCSISGRRLWRLGGMRSLRTCV